MPALPLTWINALFEKFESFYGADFTRKWGETRDVDKLKQEWAERLFPFSGDVLRQAVDHCGANVPKPPSLPEFVIICKNMKPAPEHQHYLPDKFEKTAYGMQMMEKIKTMLANKRIN